MPWPERHASDPEFPGWLVTSMLEDIGLSLAHAGRHDEAIAAFERALELGWDVVPDGRCEIARVLLLAGRDAEADVLWADLRAADPDGVWTLNAGGLACAQVGRDEEAVEWLAAGLRRAVKREDPEHVVDQMSDARRSSLRRLGRGLDDLEREVEAFRARSAVREQERLSELRSAAKRAGIPVRGSSATIAWLTEADYDAARARWPGWIESVTQDEPFDERRKRMERHLRQRHADGDGPFQLVTIDLEPYAAWCAERGYEPADRRSRASFAVSVRDTGGGRSWPPGRNDPCWCGSGRKYKRCCGALASNTVGR
ncbi:MAG: SEC-C metal-binding domain-containing protein [Actinomycetota bacterium]|nr:SEC-C metal-binding domain-containing protein [Actinomycetota bacterium]